MKFTKMQGIGNDYVYINCFEESVHDPSVLAKKISDRHFGVGSDGLVLICPSQKADLEMQMFNSDGSQSQMCGNALRCVGKYAYENNLVRKPEITVETLAGIKTLHLTIENGKAVALQADMGEPILRPSLIPVTAQPEDTVFIKKPLFVGDKQYEATCLSMGNPHCVIYEREIERLDLNHIGPLFENHPAFPEKINTEFVEILNPTHLKMRVWERGAGETLACGTGACAALVASVLCGLTRRKATLHLLGGDLQVEWRESDNHVYKTGPAEFVFEGNYPQ